MITVTAFDPREEHYGTDLPLSNGIYLHGNAENIADFDLCNVSKIPYEDGVFGCEIKIKETTYDGWLYYWRVNGYDRGLVIFRDDKTAEKEASNLYKQRTETI